jgi:DMSO reductase anchor subunit
MRPDPSVLLLTTLIGVGQGLFLALYTAEAYALFDLLPPQNGHVFYAHGSALALLLCAAGLGASFFHLGRPSRAWRAASQWRTSWLSREVIALPLFMAIVFVYGVLHLTGSRPTIATLPSGIAIDLGFAVGAAGTLVAFALYVCTAMIYACLPFVREWASALTPVNFVLMGGASGFTLAAAFSAAAAPALVAFYAGWALILTTAAAVTRIASLVRNTRLRPRSTLQTAIGIKHPRIAQKSMGFTGGSFNTREFFHGRAPLVVRNLRTLFVAGAFVLPAGVLALVLSGAIGPGTLLPAALIQFAGLLVERWVFFADANHPQNLYYGARA